MISDSDKDELDFGDCAKTEEVMERTNRKTKILQRVPPVLNIAILLDFTLLQSNTYTYCFFHNNYIIISQEIFQKKNTVWAEPFNSLVVCYLLITAIPLSERSPYRALLTNPNPVGAVLRCTHPNAICISNRTGSSAETLDMDNPENLVILKILVQTNADAVQSAILYSPHTVRVCHCCTCARPAHLNMPTLQPTDHSLSAVRAITESRPLLMLSGIGIPSYRIATPQFN